MTEIAKCKWCNRDVWCVKKYFKSSKDGCPPYKLVRMHFITCGCDYGPYSRAKTKEQCITEWNKLMAEGAEHE